ncbi:MAG TPA: 2OG-Fe(II) oxygenase family protein [Sphingorhabdus sp.]|nr:2OG-Fe(II) oxygenase family protein [Sphingorhabdus sp.]
MDVGALFQTAIAARHRQDIETAVEAIDQAAGLAPAHPQIAAVRAQLHYESWRPASALFAHAAMLAPDDSQLVRNRVLALVSEGAGAEGESILECKLSERPDWLEGHAALSRIRLTSAQAEHDRSYAQACRTNRANLALRLAWFQDAAIRKDWTKVGAILADAERDFPGQRALASARYYLACESGDDSGVECFGEEIADIADPGLDLCRVRFHLRRGDYRAAEPFASRHIGTASASMFWPYLSLVWRLIGNAKAEWLDGAPPYLSLFDLDFSESEVSNLAGTLRTLHHLQAPYPEQSVRGGTQTDRPLFFNPDPTIQAARAKITVAVRQYIDALPGADPDHPLLAPRRDRILFEGSWSVRLQDKGHHASHTHVMGWISSAFYVALPDAPGAEPAGWFALGTPPPELGLDLPPYATVEPKPGRLVLFPSTMWHSTFPFEVGERLSIAFDIKRL